MFDETTSRPPFGESRVREDKIEVLVNPLPEETKAGDTISFTDTIISNSEFDSIILFRIAEKFGLEPIKDEDYKKMQDYAENDEVVRPIKETLARESERSYQVVEEVKPEKEGQPEADFSYNRDFFAPFYYLPENGIKVFNSEDFDQAEVAYIGGGLKTRAFSNMEESQVYGDREDRSTYLSTDYATAMTHLADSKNKPVLIEVSLEKLLKYRQIFQDPESAYIQNEKGKTFMVFHGIPMEAIRRFLILEEKPPDSA